MLPKKPLLKPTERLPNFAVIVSFTRGCTELPLIQPKIISCQKSTTANTDIDVEDAEQFANNEKLIDDATPENSIMTDELAAIIKSALSALPEDLRTALTLREFEDMSYEDIAAIMDCPVGTVRSRIFRAREFLDERVLGADKKN